MPELSADENNRLRSKAKLELIERLKALDLDENQIIDLNAVANGEPTQSTILKMVFDFLKNATNPVAQMWYKGGVLAIFLIVIVVISCNYPDSEKQVWTLVGTLMGFVFGQNSKILNI